MGNGAWIVCFAADWPEQLPESPMRSDGILEVGSRIRL